MADFVRLLPYLFFAAFIILLIVFSYQIRKLKKQRLDDAIKFKEFEIEQKYAQYDDYDVLRDLNKLGSSDSDKKE